MRFFVFSKNDAKSTTLKGVIEDKLTANESFIIDEENPELVISVGGDGCFLRCMRSFISQLDKIAFVGISSGKLGFLCDYRENELDELIDNILHNVPRYSTQRLVQVHSSYFNDMFLNEVRIEKMFNTMICDVFINDEQLERFRGNGLNFSSPTGSSAYNRSLGGPLIHPHIHCLIMGEIASINHNMYRSLGSYLVLREEDVVTLKGNFKDCTIGGDTYFHKITDEEANEPITISLSDSFIKFARYRNNNYYQRLKKSFVME